jgi:hypothetical protein
MSTGIRISGMNTTFFYPFCKYPWISNATHTVGTDSSEFMPNEFFTRGHVDNGYPLPSLYMIDKPHLLPLC